MKERCTICGIAGYIGKSKKPKITYELASCLFDYLELRGTDAAGIWGTEAGKKNRVIYHKEPGRSSNFIKLDIWKKLEKLKPNLLLMHARATSPGVGHASNNKNNHPFVSSDHSIGMIHNGRVSEADFLKEKYQIRSDTDSEVLLRMYEHGSEDEDELDIEAGAAARLKGLKDIWSLVHEGAMAVAFGEYVDPDTRYLFLFRNQHRPLWIADVRDTLGQIFFFSSPEIWYRAVASSDTLKSACESMNSLIEIPVGQVWFFKIDKDNPCVGYGEDSYAKFDIDISNSSSVWEKGDFCQIKEPVHQLPIISQLDEEDRVIYSSNKAATSSSDSTKYRMPPYRPPTHSPQGHIIPYHGTGASCGHGHGHGHDDPDYREFYGWEGQEYKGTEHEDIITEIDHLLSDFGAQLGNSFLEASLKDNDYEDGLESLRHVKQELEGAIRSLNSY